MSVWTNLWGTSGSGESLWQKIGAVLSPTTSGDNVSIIGTSLAALLRLKNTLGDWIMKSETTGNLVLRNEATSADIIDLDAALLVKILSATNTEIKINPGWANFDFFLEKNGGGTAYQYNSGQGRHVFTALISMANIPSGATAVGAGAGTNDLWVTASHATLPDGVVMRA